MHTLQALEARIAGNKMACSVGANGRSNWLYDVQIVLVFFFSLPTGGTVFKHQPTPAREAIGRTTAEAYHDPH